MLNGERRAALRQFITFNLVGVLNTVVDFIVFAVLIWAGVYYVAAQLASYGAGMLNSYFMNNRFTFASRNRSTTKPSGADYGKLLRFALWNGIMLGLSVLMLMALERYTDLSELYAKAVVTVVIVVINFYGSKRYVFRSTEQRHEEGQKEA